jgi:tetratricopeptide (TPR) repeat protein
VKSGSANARAIVVATAMMLSPTLAWAENAWSGEVPAKARSLAERGRAFHDSGDYANAIIAFTQAYVIAPSPALLFNLAQAYRLQGNCDDAALMYRRYIATNPSPEGRALAEGHLANMERCIHKLSLHIPVETSKGMTITTPAPDPLTAAVTLPGPSRKAEIEKDVGVGLMVGGSVSLALAVYYAAQAHNATTEVNDLYAKGAPWKEVAPVDQRGKSASTNAKVFGGGAAVGIAGGVAMYLLGRHTENMPVTIVPTTRGAQVSMSWAF